MSKRVAIFLLVVSLALAILGSIELKRNGGSGYGDLMGVVGVVGVFVCLIFGKLLFRENAWARRPIKLGSETLPPGKDVSAVLVQGAPISDDAKNDLLKAIRRAKRAAVCGSVSKELPFQIVDHWGGVWELQAYLDTAGNRGFSANRVFYSGRAAEVVARCVGL